MAPSRTKSIIGWVLTLLLAALLLGPSAMGKFTDWEGKAQMLEKMGFTSELLFQIGILEVVVTLVYLIPRTAFLGAILLTGYLGGAIVTHLRLGDPVVMPVIIAVMIWIALALRRPHLFALALGHNPSAPPVTPVAERLPV